ncbi:MAG: glycosyl hydrolase family 5 [Chitinivibrionales bacterium]|nr:glycosyl hydrolase family 5 [Chitinivibrionales bacterium]
MAHAKRRTYSIAGPIAGIALALVAAHPHATRLANVGVVDQGYLMVHFLDGEVVFADAGTGPHAFTHSHHTGQDTVKRFDPALNVTAATTPASWTLTSGDDSNYGAGGRHPTACHRKTKVNGHSEQQWTGSDFAYEYTFEHYLYLQLPSPLQQGCSYTLSIAAATNTDDTEHTFTYNIFQCRSEAVHVNLVGYHPQPAAKAADLYIWLGDGGARDYSGFEGNRVILYDVATGDTSTQGTVSFLMNPGQDVGWYDLTRSPVWNVDFPNLTTPGTYRLAIEGVGCSQDFELREDIYFEPFRVSVLGFFYMRIGQDSAGGIRPVPRRPLYIPETDPVDTRVYLTTMHPYHSSWGSFSSGDVWDKPNDWAPYRVSGHPTNPRAHGGHSDALDWDRHLGHITIIYDMLLPFILTAGAIDNDDLGIAESGNGIPDILDEARNEVDFWLRLRDGAGYSHGLTNPNGQNELFQAAPTAIAAWANAANAAMLADCFRIAGEQALMEEYRDSAVAAYTHANGLSDPMLDRTQNAGETVFQGRDLKLMAAVYLYNVTGDTQYEDVIDQESVCTGPTAVLDDYNAGNSRNQVWATAGYLMTPRTVGLPTLYENMKASVIYQAKQKETGAIESRPSRRATDLLSGYFRTTHNVQRTMIAHAVTDNAQDKALFRKAMLLEADYGLGRNPLNMIQMTTATTALASRRSVQGAYTSGSNDGSPGMHPGHTPYMNLDDWACGMEMGCPSRLYSRCYPAEFRDTWPIGEGYFNTRYVWAHNEFTPQQTMRGKMALYGYLYGLGAKASSSTYPRFDRGTTRAAGSPAISLRAGRIRVSNAGYYDVIITDLAGRILASSRRRIGREGLNVSTICRRSAVTVVRVRGMNLDAIFRHVGIR